MRVGALSFVPLLHSVHSLVFHSEDREVNFDDRRTTPAAFQVNEVGIYGGLKWSGFSIDEPRLMQYENELTGVEVKSAPNYAGGRVDFFGGLPAIDANYDGSHVAFFDFEKFWWGCTTMDNETNNEVPGWCTLEIHGFSHGVEEPVAKAISFFFPKDKPRTMPMVETLLPSTFKAVSRIEFSLFAANPTLYLDDVSFRLYNVTSIGTGLGEAIHGRETSQSEFSLQLEGGASHNAVEQMT